MDHAQFLEHRSMFDGYLKHREHHLSVYHFSSIFLWQDFFEFTFETIDGYLFILATHDLGTFLYLPPLGGELDPALIEKAFIRLNRANRKPSFSRIENVAEEDLKHFDPRRYKITEKSKDYYYLKDDIVGLKGNAYKSKRSSYNHFMSNHSREFVDFSAQWEHDCESLYDIWSENRATRSKDEVYRAMLEENRGVHRLIRRYQDELGLEGRVVLVDGRVQAYTFGYRLNEPTFCVLVEIINLDLKGLSVYIFNRFCADDRVKPFRWINVMDDFAMDNVARAKESFHPKKYHVSYVVTERE